jgi:hypothetical protein
MPKVRVPRKNVTPGEIVTVLSRRLGPGYQVESNGGRRVMVRKSPLMYASIAITDQPGASVFRVHGGGFIFLRLVNTFGTARRVADALRRSPEFRSLLASQPEGGAELRGRRGRDLAASRSAPGHPGTCKISSVMVGNISLVPHG